MANKRTLLGWAVAIGVLCGSTATSVWAQARSSQNPLVREAQDASQQALALARSPRGAAWLFRLNALRDELPDLSLLARTYGGILEKRDADFFTRTAARMLWVEVERARGNLNRATELSRPLGYVRNVYVTGGFDNEGKTGCDTDYGPEAALDLSARYSARGHEVTWNKVQTRPHDGYVDLGSAVRPNQEVVAYALALLETPVPTRVNLSFGVSGGYRLFVNGQKVDKSDRYNAARPDQSRVAVQLGRGVNRILLKVCHDTGPLGFYLRYERSGGGETPSNVSVETLPPQVKDRAAATVLPTLTSVLETQVQRSPKDAQLHADLAMVLGTVRSYDDAQRTVTTQAQQAAALAPQNARLLVEAAVASEDDGNARRQYLESALRVDPNDLRAVLSLAQHELTRGHPERVLTLLQPWTEKVPTLGRARVLLARAHEALGEQALAANLIESAMKDLPGSLPVVREAAAVAKRLGRLREALQRYRVALSMRYDDLQSRRSAAAILADFALIDDAATELQTILQLDPFDNLIRLQLADLLGYNGRADEAQALYATAKALSPDDWEVHEREGRAHLQAGQRAKALAAFERALLLRPQNPALKEVLRTLKGEDIASGAQFTLDVRAIAQSPEAKALAHEDVIQLVDYSYTRVQPNGLSSRLHQLAVQVNTARGVESFRNYPITYSPDRQEVRLLRARITKPDGSVVESYSEGERNLNEPWSGMYYDARARVLSFPALAPHDVLELQYRVDDTSTDNLLSDYWGEVDYVQGTAPKLRYQFFVDMPQGRELYWNSKQVQSRVQYAQQPQKDGRVLHRWTAQNVAKVLPEPSMPGWAEVVTTLHVSTYRDWEQVGRYYWNLVKDQLTPNEDLKKTVNTVLTGVDRKNELAVIRAIYNFVVTNTRYVALEFGIHGFKPYRVDRILARRFGDCKDKASLIHAMLKVAGVDSRLVLLRMRQLGNLSPEPASLAAFNHAIAYVPKHQLFLDGTAEFHGTTELPIADRRANVLIVEPDGPSQFGITPEATPDSNVLSLNLAITLAPNGSAKAKGTTRATGVNAPDFRRTYQTVASRKTAFEQSWSQTFPGLAVESMTLSDTTQLNEPVKVDYVLAIPRMAEVLPNTLRFYPFASGRAFTQVFAALPSRQFDLALTNPWQQTFDVEVTPPPGYEFGPLPENIQEEAPFGRLLLTHQKVNGKLVSHAEVVFASTRITPKDYPAFRNFLTRADQAFSRKVVAVTSSSQSASAAAFRPGSDTAGYQ